MDYSQFNTTILEKVMATLKLINNPEIDPTIRQLNQEILFREVGSAIYAKIYDMNAFDFEVEHTRGLGLDDRYYGLAKVASGSVSAGNIGLQEYVRNYLDYAANKAQYDAMTNASQSGKHPKVTRTINKETCPWCEKLAGVYYDPPAQVFHRHGGCDCSIITEGYKTRNGQLNNYVKPKDRWTDARGQRTEQKELTH